MQWISVRESDTVSGMSLSSLLSASLLFAFVNAPAAEPEERSFYLIGNSLTQDTVPSRLDGDVQWHVDCGKSLPYIFENPQKPCVENSTLWPGALKEKQYDLISVQVHYGSTLETDAAVISEFLKLQPKAVFVIHSGWARSKSRLEEYSSQSAQGPMKHSPAYIEALLEKLTELHPGREFRQTHAQDLLTRIDLDIKAEKAPFGRLEDLYRDDIHMNVVTGRYLMHNAMRHALGQGRSVKGFEAIPSPVKAYLDRILDTLATAKP